MSIVIAKGPFLVLMTAFAAVIVAIVLLAKQGKTAWVKIRTLPPLEAISDAIGRATEMGKPVIINPGEPSGYSQALNRAETLSSFTAANNIVGYAAEMCARLGVSLFVPISFADTIDITFDTVRSAYMKAGKIDSFNPTSVYFASGQDAGYNAYMQGLLRKERPGLYITFGSSGSGAQLEEAARFTGAMVIGGIARVSQVGTRIATCDYLLMGDELYAAGAYVSKDPNKISTIFSVDLIKIFWCALMIAGIIAISAGSSIFSFLKG